MRFSEVGFTLGTLYSLFDILERASNERVFNDMTSKQDDKKALVERLAKQLGVELPKPAKAGSVPELLRQILEALKRIEQKVNTPPIQFPPAEKPWYDQPWTIPNKPWKTAPYFSPNQWDRGYPRITC